jgi:enediyne biosynthesis protein E4
MIKNSKIQEFSKISYCILCLLFFCSCTENKEPLFTILAPIHSGITFENKIEETPEINILTYEYTYNGGGAAAGDFNNDGLCDLYFTGNAVKNQLYLNQKNLKFKNITDSRCGGKKSLENRCYCS